MTSFHTASIASSSPLRVDSELDIVEGAYLMLMSLFSFQVQKLTGAISGNNQCSDASISSSPLLPSLSEASDSSEISMVSGPKSFGGNSVVELGYFSFKNHV